REGDGHVAGRGRLPQGGLDDEVAELFGGGEPAQSFEGQLEGLRRGSRLLAQHPGGGVQVLGPEGVGHVVGGHVQRRQLLRVEPGAHAVVADAHEVDLRDAVDAQQLVVNVDLGEVAQVDVVVAAVGRGEVNDVEDVGRLLADGDPLGLDGGR